MVSALCFVAFLAQPVAPRQMAFAARFYAPLHSKTKSRYELYLCDLDGKHLRKITTGANAVEVRWISKSKLAYSTFDEALPNPVQEYWTINRDGTGRRKTKSADPEFEWGMSPEGRPFRLLDKGQADRFIDLSEEDQDTGREMKAEKSFYHFVNLPGIASLYMPNDHNGTGFNGLYYDSRRSRFWATFWTHNSTTGASNYFATFTSKSQRLVFVNPEAAEIDLTPERSVYAMVTPRDLAPYGKKNVWYSRLYIGDWTKPSWKEIKFGQTVDFKSVAIRP